ncbi:MAG: antitoxin [Acidobacteriota bacterium]
MGNLKNITFSVSAESIKRARLRAAIERTTLNEKVREWVDNYATRKPTLDEYDRLMKKMSYARPGRKFTREEMNER